MSSLYKRIEELCAQSSISITEMCRQSGASRASLSDLKAGRKQGLSSDTLQKISTLFSISLDFLMGTPPFDCWDEINQNRAGFLHYADISPDVLSAVFGIDASDPDSASIKSFIDLLSVAVVSATPTGEGDWEIKLRPEYINKKAPATKDGCEIKLDDFTYAMHNHSGDLTDSDKDILLSMAERLAAANKIKRAKTDGDAN